jgi:hypothetical protein
VPIAEPAVAAAVETRSPASARAVYLPAFAMTSWAGAGARPRAGRPWPLPSSSAKTRATPTHCARLDAAGQSSCSSLLAARPAAIYSDTKGGPTRNLIRRRRRHETKKIRHWRASAHTHSHNVIGIEIEFENLSVPLVLI